DRWEGTSNQVLLASPGQVRTLLPNSNPEYQNPKELLDPRLRQALYRAVDRQAVSDAVTRGFAPVADSFIAPFYEIRRDVEPAIPQYPYDLAAAERGLRDLTRNLVRTVMTELPIMPIYWDLDPILVASGVSGVPQPSAPTRISTFNIAAWEKA